MIKKVAYTHVYINVMELLVAEEVEQQFNRLPARVSKYIKRSEVETFALNRLPALYASSEKGLQHQLSHGRKELQVQIGNAVRQALLAVQVDPIRLSQPIHIEGSESSQADAVLQLLSEWLRSPNLTWETALPKIQKLNQRSKERSQTTSYAPDQVSAQRQISLPSPPHRKTSQPTFREEQAYAMPDSKPNQPSAILPSIRSTVRHTNALSRSTKPIREMVSAQRETAVHHPAQNTNRRPGTYGIRSDWSLRPDTVNTPASKSDAGFEDTYLR